MQTSHPPSATTLVSVLAILCGALSAPLAAQQTMTPADSAQQAKLRAQAKITEDSARAIALAKVPNGTVKSSELEREHGRLVYSFDITVPNKTGVEEVLVNAKTGKVISRKHETEKQEAREEQRESKGRKHMSSSSRTY